MNIKTKLEKLEKIIGTNNETAKEFWAKYGGIPIIYIDDEMSEEEKTKTIKEKKDEYYGKIAQAKNISLEEAEKYHQQVFKKAGLDASPMIIFIVSKSKISQEERIKNEH